MTELFFLLKGIFVPCLGKNFFLPRKKNFSLMGVKSKIAGHFVQIDSHINRCQSMTMTAMTVGGYLFLQSSGNLQSQYYIYIYIYIILN